MTEKPKMLKELFATAKTEERIWYDYEREVMPKIPNPLVSPHIPKAIRERAGRKWVPVGDVEACLAVVAEKERALKELLENRPKISAYRSLKTNADVKRYLDDLDEWFESFDKKFGELEASLSLPIEEKGKNSSSFDVIVSIADILEGKDCKGKIVDMGFWFDVPHIEKQTLKTLCERGASGVRLILDLDFLKSVFGGAFSTDKSPKEPELRKETKKP